MVHLKSGNYSPSMRRLSPSHGINTFALFGCWFYLWELLVWCLITNDPFHCRPFFVGGWYIAWALALIGDSTHSHFRVPTYSSLYPYILIIIDSHSRLPLRWYLNVDDYNWTSPVRPLYYHLNSVGYMPWVGISVGILPFKEYKLMILTRWTADQYTHTVLDLNAHLLASFSS